MTHPDRHFGTLPVLLIFLLGACEEEEPGATPCARGCSQESEVRDCVSARNSESPSPVRISVVNRRDEPIYLKPFIADCNDVPHLVQATRGGAEVVLVNRFRCGGSSCESLQNGEEDGQTCNDACTRAPLVRLLPGAELGGTFGREYVQGPMLAECTPIPAEGNSVECWSATALPAATYQLEAQALLVCPGSPEECGCTGVAVASCPTRVFVQDENSPQADGIRAQATVTLPAREVTLAFE
jgi:hypothetical protein